MIISSQGFDHFTNGINNQDFGIETPRMVIVLDGCSDAKFSEIGTRLFAQLFSRKEEFDSVEKFEDNVKEIFDEIIQMMKKFYQSDDEIEEEFISENLLFTIIACFETEKEYIVKLLGDGYIITQNMNGLVSFLKYSYGRRPPYFAYRYCKNILIDEYKNCAFKTFVFDKQIFKKIAIASDGAMPIAKGIVKLSQDDLIFTNLSNVQMDIRGKRQCFGDDITVGVLGGTS